MKNILLLVFMAFVFILKAQNSLYAFYPFSGNANDSSDNGLNGILHGNPILTSDRFGNANSAYLFDGVDDYIEMPEGFDFKPRTISLWFKPMGFTTEGVIFSSENANTQYSDSKFVVNENAGSYTLNLKIGNNNYVQTMAINQWYHAAIVFSDTAISYYVNGGRVGTFYNLTNFHSANGPVYATVGCHRSFINFFHGIIDDIKVYNRALAPEEIYETFTPIAGVKRDLNFQYFPNPAKDELYIESETNLILRLFNSQGELSKELEVNSGRSVVNLSELCSGVYFIQAEDKKTRLLTRRVVVKQ